MNKLVKVISIMSFLMILPISDTFKEYRKRSGKLIFTTDDLGFYDDEILLDEESLALNNIMRVGIQNLRDSKREQEDIGDYNSDIDEKEESQPENKNIISTTNKNTHVVNYDKLKEEFQMHVKDTNKTFHVKTDMNEGEPAHSWTEAINMVVNGNCTTQLPFDLGFRAYKCFSSSKNAGKIILNVIWTWFFLYLCIAVVLWCDKGWCCCCCRCRQCYIDERIQEITIFLNENPPGQWKDGEDIYNYEPSEAELHMYDKMMEKILTI